MASVLTQPPAQLPVGLAEAKTFLRVDEAHEDDLILALLRAATASVEAMTNTRLIEQGWSVFLDDWPANCSICLPIAPALSVDELVVYGDDDVTATIDEAHYFVDVASRPARLVLRSDRVWARPGRIANGIEIRMRAGFGLAPEDVPDELKQAILHLAAHWYENREAASDPAIKAIPLGVSAMVQAFRGVGL